MENRRCGSFSVIYSYPVPVHWFSGNGQNVLLNISEHIEERGVQKGFEQGIEQGIELGEQRGMLQTLFSLIEDHVLPLETAAQKSGLTEEEFEMQYQEYRKKSLEIPMF